MPRPGDACSHIPPGAKRWILPFDARGSGRDITLYWLTFDLLHQNHLPGDGIGSGVELIHVHARGEPGGIKAHRVRTGILDAIDQRGHFFSQHIEDLQGHLPGGGDHELDLGHRIEGFG